MQYLSFKVTFVYSVFDFVSVTYLLYAVYFCSAVNEFIQLFFNLLNFKYYFIYSLYLLFLGMKTSSLAAVLRVGEPQLTNVLSHFSTATPNNRPRLDNRARITIVPMVVDSVIEVLHTLWFLSPLKV